MHLQNTSIDRKSIQFTTAIYLISFFVSGLNTFEQKRVSLETGSPFFKPSNESIIANFRANKNEFSEIAAFYGNELEKNKIKEFTLKHTFIRVYSMPQECKRNCKIYFEKFSAHGIGAHNIIWVIYSNIKHKCDGLIHNCIEIDKNWYLEHYID